MKKVLIAILAVVALASCSNEETIVVAQPDVIGFGTPFIENATRAEGSDYTTVDAFNVWGEVYGITTQNTIMLYDGALVERDGTAYNCRQTEYWVPSAKYTFLAIAGATSTTPVQDVFPTNISYTADGTTDLLLSQFVEVETDSTSSPISGVNDNNQVSFTLEHLLSKVAFTATGAEVEGYTYNVTNITIKNAKAEGSVDVASKQWTNISETTTEIGDFGGISGDFDGKPTSCASPMLLIPSVYGEGTEIEVSMVVNTYYNGELTQTTEYTGEEGKEPLLKAKVSLQPGCSYNFSFEIAVGMPIDFTIGQHNWTDTTMNIS